MLGCMAGPNLASTIYFPAKNDPSCENDYTYSYILILTSRQYNVSIPSQVLTLNIHMHVIAGYVASTLKQMECCTRRYVLQSSIARLNGSLMALNRTLAWEILRVFCYMEMLRLVEVPCLRNTTSHGNAKCGK